MSPPRFLASAAAALLLASCASGQLRPTTGLRCEADGSTRWARYETPNVTLVTELDEPLARELAAALEQGYQGLTASVLKNLHRTRVRVVAVPFDLPGYAWNTTISLNVLAHYMSFSAAALTDDEVVILMQLRGADPRANTQRKKGLDDRERIYAMYGMAWILEHLAIPAPPPWLARGLAEYLDGTRAEGDTVWVGIANQETLELKRYAELFPLRELLATTPCERADLWRTHGGPRVAAFEYQSFMLVHYLATNRGTAFTAYLARLVKGEPAAAAWSAEFPDLAPERHGGLEALDGELRRYMRQERFRALGYPAPAESFVVRRAPLSCAEARTERLELYRGLDRRDLYEREARQLLAETPGHPAGLFALAELADAAGAPAAAREAIARDPGSARAWALLAASLPPGPERDEAAGKATALGPDDAVVALRAAEVRLDAGNAAEALELATKVTAAVPWSVRGNLAQARALARLGRCAPARASLARAEGCFADRCPDLPPEPQAPPRLWPVPRATLDAARGEVAACTTR